MNAFMIAPTCIIKGLGISIGMDIAQVKGATGGYDSDYYAKCKAALELLYFGSSDLVHQISTEQSEKKQDYDFGFLHVKGIDDTGHDKKPKLKAELLHRLNDGIQRALNEKKKLLQEESSIKCGVCLTGDHSTLMRTGEHSFEPVPFAISQLSKIRKYLEIVENKERVEFINSIEIRDDVNNFDEISAGRGALGRFSGSEIMPLIQKYMSLM